jgi:hypothetical protein
MQDGAKAHSANYSIKVLNEVLEDWVISRRLWLAKSPELNTSDFRLWET